MAQNVVHVLGRCITSKAFWCILIIASSCILLLVCHSYRACATLLVFVMIGLFALNEEDNEDEIEDLL